MGGGWEFKAQPKEPKQQQEKEVRRKVEIRRALIILRRDSSQDGTFWQRMMSDGETALLQKPGMQGQGKTSWYIYTEDLIIYRPCAEIILKISCQFRVPYGRADRVRHLQVIQLFHFWKMRHPWVLWGLTCITPLQTSSIRPKLMLISWSTCSSFLNQMACKWAVAAVVYASTQHPAKPYMDIWMLL